MKYAFLRPIDEQVKTYKTLVQPDNPIGTIRRFAGIQRQFVNFDYMEVVESGPGKMLIVFKLAFGDEADKAYAHHLGGILERLMEVSGAKEVEVEIKDKCWKGNPNTTFEIKWRSE